MILELGKDYVLECVFQDYSNGSLVDPDYVQYRIYHYEDSSMVVDVPVQNLERASLGRYILSIIPSIATFSPGKMYYWEVSGYKNLVTAASASVLGNILQDFQITGLNDSFNFKLDDVSYSVVLTHAEGLHAQIEGSELEDFVFYDAAPARDIGSQLGPFSITALDTLRVSVDGGLLQTINLPVGVAVTVGEVVNEINAQAVDLLAVNNGGHLQLQSNSTGSTSVLFIGGGSANSILGFVGDSTFYGQNSNRTLKVSIDSGPEQIFQFSVGTLDANQVVSFLNGTAVDFQASNQAGHVKILNTSAEVGLRSVIDLGDGSANEVLGYELSTTRGLPGLLAQDVADQINAVVGSGAPASDSAGKVKITALTSGVDSSIEILTGSANAPLGFSLNQYSGKNELRENFLQTDEILVVETLTPILDGIVVSLVS